MVNTNNNKNNNDDDNNNKKKGTASLAMKSYLGSLKKCLKNVYRLETHFVGHVGARLLSPVQNFSYL